MFCLIQDINKKYFLCHFSAMMLLKLHTINKINIISRQENIIPYKAGDKTV